MGGKLTKDGVILPGNEDVTQTKSILSVDGKEADEKGNIDLGGAFDYVDKNTQIRGCKALTWNTLRVQGIDDWERQRGSELKMDEESLTVSTLTGEYVYIAEIDAENKNDNQKIFNLLNDFHAISGSPILINTSLNIKGPIAMSPTDAFNYYIESGVKTLVLNNWIIEKN